MKLLTPDLITALLAENKGPFLSLYQPTHRILPYNLQDPLRFKNLVKLIQLSLLQKYSVAETSSFLKPFHELESDNHFWAETLDGIAVFGSPNLFEVINLQTPVPEIGVAADSFHLKPLRQYLQTSDRFQILALSFSDVRFYEGNRHSIVQIELPADFAKTVNEALGEEHTERYATAKSLSGPPGRTNLQHGQGTKKDDMEKDAERFFRLSDKLAHDKFSRDSKLPLILAALPEHHHLFHKISHNPMLMERGINVNPKSISLEKLRELAWEILEPEYNSKIDFLIDKFKQSKSHRMGSDNLNKIVTAANQGRVDTLLIESGRMIPGKIYGNQIEKRNLNHPEIDDVLDDIGEIVTKKGGLTMILPMEKMPTQTGLAAIFRF